MNREEYKKEAEKIFNKEMVKRVTFPNLLMYTAQHLFVEGDMNSEFAEETRRRLKQLDKLGYTDE